MTKPRFAIGLQGDKVRNLVIDRLRQMTFAAEAAAAAGYTVTKLQQAK